MTFDAALAEPYLKGPYKKRPRCHRGHLLEGENVRFNNGKLGRMQRCCITCQKEREKKYKNSPEVRAKRTAAMRAWVDKNLPKVELAWHRKALKRYGITPEKYAEMLASQDGVCAICKKTCSSGRRLAVDHDHASGKVRGLLCGNCNQGIGRFLHAENLLTAAIEYLRSTQIA